MAKVTLRNKPISGGGKSLYLDFYPPIPHPETHKITRREFLGLHLYIKAKTDAEKRHNKETLVLAENICTNRLLAVQNDQYGFLSKKIKNTNFITYFTNIADSRASNKDVWVTATFYLDKFANGSLRVADINETFCDKYRNHLLKAPSKRNPDYVISQNSAYSYFSKFKAALRQAFRDGLILSDLSSKIESIKEAETERQFLTMEEVNLLAQTECGKPILKQAALFSILTGLRFSDIHKLIWKELQFSETGGGYFIQFMQKKTKSYEVLPISEQAFHLCGERGNDEDIVFKNLKYSTVMNHHLKRWILKAGISKNIGFHGFRHTNATLMLAAGVDIYTVSKRLGHKDLKTTAIYTHIVDEKKREAADKIRIIYKPSQN